MAKLTIEYRCGHEVAEVRFGGKYTEQLAYAKEHLDCPECYRASQQEVRQTAAANRLPRIAHLSPCELQGSPKQIAWAIDIRSKMLVELLEVLETITTVAEQDKVEKLLAILASEPSAKWWIDQRERSSIHLAAEVAKAHGLIPDRSQGATA